MKKRNSPEVLVVEDEFATRMVAADAIADIGLIVREAADAEEALEELVEHPNIGVIFTDVQLPGAMNGLDLAVQVHGDKPSVELIVTSGGTKLQDSQLPDSGTFLAKPYRTSELVTIVRQKAANFAHET